MRKINLIVVHCSATPKNRDIGVSEIRRWHKARGWSDIGYHYVIRRNGDLERGRPIKKAGAHAKGFNKHSIGICLVGGLGQNQQPENNFTQAQFRTLKKALAKLKDTYPDAEIKGHRDLGAKKACPCFDVSAWLAGTDEQTRRCECCGALL